MSVYLGIDLGGTNIKVAVVDSRCHVLSEADRPTLVERGPEAVSDDIIAAMDEALATAGLTRSDLGGVGVGCPGTIDDKAGIVVYANNLYWNNFPMRDYLRRSTGISIALGNDANVAALGEVYAGCARGAESAVIVTLGTGVGSGVVLNGVILTGFTGAASEMGHMVIVKDGAPCTCGRKGCFESYASATGLIRMTDEALAVYPDSLMAAMVRQEGKTSGKTAFLAAKQGDAAGQAVVDEYIGYLAEGLANIVNTFFPEVIGLSGGISREGENLLVPLREEVYTRTYGGNIEPRTRIMQCTLGYKAGLVGAAMLGKQWAESHGG